MFLGDKNYFVTDINCEVMFNATYNGKVYAIPLINKSDVDSEMRKNKEKALREYYNKFSIDGGDRQPFKRAVVIRNSVVRLPVLRNEFNEKKRFVLAYDPARTLDNSVIMVAEIIEDKNIGERLEICNCVNLVDIAKKKKTPMQTPEQIKVLKQLLLEYNGNGFADYENIDCLLIDSGQGGGGILIADYFMPNWEDLSGIKRKGLIDKIESKDYIAKFNDAVDKLKLMAPQAYKKEMFEALIEMFNLGLISFTSEYDNKGYLMIPEETGKMVEYIDDEGNKVSEKEIKYKKVKLDFEQEVALIGIDSAKEELFNIYRYESSNGNCRYDLSEEKKNTSDDKAYCLAMLGWYLQQLRRKHITGKEKKTINLADYFIIKNNVSRINDLYEKIY